MNKFTIVIPVYNASDFLKDCLDSLLAQDYKNWIAICVNDGSKDDSLDILNNYSKNDTRFQILSHQNHGVSFTRNRALQKIENNPSNWVVFLDADDYIAPDMLSSLNSIISRVDDQNAKYIKTTCRSIKNRTFPLNTKHSFEDLSFELVTNSEYFKRGNVGGFVASIVVRSDFINDTSIFFPTDMKVLEDQVFSIQLALRSEKIILINTPFYYYFQDANSQGNKNFNASDIVKCFNYIKDSIRGIDDKDILSYFKNKFFPIKIGLLYGSQEHKQTKALHCGKKDVRKYLFRFRVYQLIGLPGRIGRKIISFLK